jgi:hypothetical protein
MAPELTGEDMVVEDIGLRQLRGAEFVRGHWLQPEQEILIFSKKSHSYLVLTSHRYKSVQAHIDVMKPMSTQKVTSVIW